MDLVKEKNYEQLRFFENFLPLQTLDKSDVNNAMRIFFNLFYAKNPPLLKIANIDSILSKISNNEKELAQIYAIIVSCNTQNIDAFFKIKSFTDIIGNLNIDLANLQESHHLDLIMLLQNSVLASDLKDIVTILKSAKALRDSGIISFHDQKCIQTVLRTYAKKESKNVINNIIVGKTLANMDILDSILVRQNNILPDIKELLANTIWTKEIAPIFNDNYKKNILFIGRKKSGKATLMRTMLYRNMQEDLFDSICPIIYEYGNETYNMEFLSESELLSMTNTPNKLLNDMVKLALEEYKEEYIKCSFDYTVDELKEVYNTNKMQIAKNLSISKNIELLKYARFINMPSIPTTTYRHLQIDSYMIKSDIVAYLINANSTKDELLIDINFIADLILRENIQKIFIIFTKIDKSNFTSKKLQSYSNLLKNMIENKLNKHDSKNLEKIEIHFSSANIAYNIRTNKTSNIDFDINATGLPDLEKSIKNHICNTPLKNFDMIVLKNILQLLSNKNDIVLSNEELENIKLHVKTINDNCRAMGVIFMLENTQMHDWIMNLKDNLYYQLIDSINFMISNKNRSHIVNTKRLKKTTVDSMLVGLYSLADRRAVIDNKNLANIKATFSRHVNNSLFALSKTQNHKEIITAIYNQIKQIIAYGYSTHRGNIIIQHFENRLNTIFKDEMSKMDFKDDYYIKMLKESFDYYFLMLEKNISLSLEERSEFFSIFYNKIAIILESIFIHYFTKQDSTKCDVTKEALEFYTILNAGI